MARSSSTTTVALGGAVLHLGSALAMAIFLGCCGAASSTGALVETCRCGSGGAVLCDINDIISTTRPDPAKPRDSYYFVSVLNNCGACSAAWVAVQSQLPGYPILLKNGSALKPMEVLNVGPNPGPPVNHPPTQVNFTCVRPDSSAANS